MKRYRITSKEAKRQALAAVMAVMGEDRMEVVIRRYVENKTTEQRAWFHMLCKMFGDETGYSQGEVKELIKREILGTSLVELAGRKFEIVKASESQDKAGYSELIEGTYRLAAEAGVVLPSPRS